MSVGARGSRRGRLLFAGPITVGVALVVAVIGFVTGALQSPLESRELYALVASGPAATSRGHWWAFVTSPWFAPTPTNYVSTTVVALAVLGWAEMQLGGRRVTKAAVVCHLVATVGSAQLVAAWSSTSWTWAEDTAQVVGVGLGPAAVGSAAAATVAVASPWRARLRIALVVYGVLMFAYFGDLWNLEHLCSVLAGLALGPVLVGRGPELRAMRASRYEWTLVAGWSFVFASAVRVALCLLSSDGPMGVSDVDGRWELLVAEGTAVAVVGFALLDRSRPAWRAGLLLSAMGASLGIAVLVARLTSAGSGTVTDSLAPSSARLLIDVVLCIGQGLVLVLSRRAFCSDASHVAESSSLLRGRAPSCPDQSR